MGMNNKLITAGKRMLVMADVIYKDTDHPERTICRGIILRKTSKGWYRETNKKMLFAFLVADLEPGAIYSLEARLAPDTTYDSLYQVHHAELLACASYAAMFSFLLRSEDATPKRVRLLLEKYGMDVLDEIADDYCALDFLGLSPDMQGSLYTFASKRLLFSVVLHLLMKYKLDCRLAVVIYDKYKKAPLEMTLSTILGNPYTLFMDKVCTFNETDSLYLRMGNPPSSELRCHQAILATLQAAAENGDICIPRQEFHGAMWTLLRQTEDVTEDAPCPFTSTDVTQAISQLKELKLISWDTVGDKNGIYLRDNIIAERTITRYILDAVSSGNSLYPVPLVKEALEDFEADSGLVLDDEQCTAVCTAITSPNPISIITGGPGTGKTQTLNAIQEVLLSLCPEIKIIGCAPTGKAATRMKEASEIGASTIHKLLQLSPGDTWVSKGSVKCDYVIVDESTLVDTWLMSKLLYALDPDARRSRLKENATLLGMLSMDWTERGGRYSHQNVRLFDEISYRKGSVCACFSKDMALYLRNCPIMPLPLSLLAISGKSPHSYLVGRRCLVHNAANKGREWQPIRVGNLLAACPRIPRPNGKWVPSILERQVITPFMTAMKILVDSGILTWKLREPVCRNDYDSFADSVVEFRLLDDTIATPPAQSDAAPMRNPFDYEAFLALR